MSNLLIENLTVLLAIGGIVLLLSLVQLFLAINQDKRETNAGPIKELEELKVEIQRKEAQKLEIEGEVDKFRKTLADQAELKATADQLQNRIDELNTEWGSLTDKRKELSEFLVESEKAQVERTQIDAELRKTQSQLAEIKDKLIEREELEQTISSLNNSKSTLDEELKTLREEVADLKQMKSDAERLREDSERLTREIATLDGTKEARTHELESLKSEGSTLNKEVSELKSKQAQAYASLEAETVELNSVKKQREQLSADIAVLEALLKQKSGELSGGVSDPDRDPIEELKVTPPVIREIEKLDEYDVASETDALKTVQERFKALGLQYHDRVLNAFHTTMKTNETTQMAVLAGISGTGKSQLPRQYAIGMGIGFLQIPVQPRWDSPQDLMGFYNYIEGAFKPTDMARALWALDVENNDEALQDRMLMIMLDEMNLARVEYYFSDFLSRLESRPIKSRVSEGNERKDAEIELEIPGQDNQTVRLFPGYNLLFAGTMNEDETTQSLSDKVIDRANVLRFGAPEALVDLDVTGSPPATYALSKSRWQKWVRNVASLQADRPLVDDSIGKMSDLMKEFGRPFGHRLGGAMKSYVSNYPETDGMDRIRVALADQVEMRLLPKLRGVDVDDYAGQFGQLQNFVQSELNDTKLSDAIERSVEMSQQNRQFTWTGVTR